MKFEIFAVLYYIFRVHASGETSDFHRNCPTFNFKCMLSGICHGVPRLEIYEENLILGRWHTVRHVEYINGHKQLDAVDGMVWGKYRIFYTTQLPWILLSHMLDCVTFLP